MLVKKCIRENLSYDCQRWYIEPLGRKKEGEFKFLLQRTRENCLAQNFPYYPTSFNTSLEISLAEDPKMNSKKAKNSMRNKLKWKKKLSEEGK